MVSNDHLYEDVSIVHICWKNSVQYKNVPLTYFINFDVWRISKLESKLKMTIFISESLIIQKIRFLSVIKYVHIF